ncbi:hypothetical protein K491DRAFT_16120 [Lophiostoma macrostomum CBS 122681]|uniref:Uncharacterized protein n=1 Tax=Lophiostoma macrostomum CBS 122681 TaxID=1314788 RepID=A0A6A6TPF7_9PLEO|nr:hypothetical protein K491DRAFT_16120 [Lophiostoma macrostomum CBS 122681]
METMSVANPDTAVPNACSPAPAGSTTSVMGAVRGEHGFINVAMLESIVDTLLQTQNEDDAQLGDWINANYIQPPIGPEEKSREITTRADFSKIHSAYQRAQSLTGRTVPEKWPFFDARLKEMPRAIAKEKARSSASDKAEEDLPAAKGDNAVTGAMEQSSITEETLNEPGVAAEASPPSHFDARPFVMTIENMSPMTAAHSDPVVTNLDNRPPSAYNNNKRKSTTPVNGSRKTKRTSYRGRGRGSARGGRFTVNTREDDEEEEIDTDGGLTEDLGRMENVTFGERVKKSIRKTIGVPKPKDEAPTARTTRSKTQKVSSKVAAEAKGADSNLIDAANQTFESPRVRRGLAVPGKAAFSPDIPVTPSTPSRLSVDSVIPTPSESVSGELIGSTNGNNGTPQVSSSTTIREDSLVESVFSDANTQRLTSPSPAVAKPVDLTSTGYVSNIDFFARVQTSKGMIEIPISRDRFTGDAEMIMRYADWKQQEEGMDLSLDQFAKISSFAKKT